MAIKEQITDAQAAMALAVEAPKIIITSEWYDMQQKNEGYIVDDTEFESIQIAASDTSAPLVSVSTDELITALEGSVDTSLDSLMSIVNLKDSTVAVAEADADLTALNGESVELEADTTDLTETEGALEEALADASAATDDSNTTSEEEVVVDLAPTEEEEVVVTTSEEEVAAVSTEEEETSGGASESGFLGE